MTLYINECEEALRLALLASNDEDTFSGFAKDDQMHAFLRYYSYRLSRGPEPLRTDETKGALVPPPSDDFNPLYVLVDCPVMIENTERNWREWMHELAAAMLAERICLPLMWQQLWIEFNSKISPLLERMPSRTMHKYGACLISHPMVTMRGVAEYFCQSGTPYYLTAYHTGLQALVVATAADIAKNEPVSGATMALIAAYIKAGGMNIGQAKTEKPSKQKRKL